MSVQFSRRPLRKVVVSTGSRYQGAALLSLMKLFDIPAALQVYKPTLDILSDAVEAHAASGEDPHVLLVLDQAEPVSHCIRVVTRLRNQFLWEGGCIAIVPSNDAKKILDKADLFGQPSSVCAFGILAGHASLTQPVSVSQLLQAYLGVGEMRCNRWDHLRRSSKTIGDLEALLNKTKALSRIGDSGAALVVAARIVDCMRSTSWSNILVHATEHKAVLEILDRFPPGKQPSSQNDLERVTITLAEILHEFQRQERRNDA